MFEFITCSYRDDDTMSYRADLVCWAIAQCVVDMSSQLSWEPPSEQDSCWNVPEAAWTNEAAEFLRRDGVRSSGVGDPERGRERESRGQEEDRPIGRRTQVRRTRCSDEETPPSPPTSTPIPPLLDRVSSLTLLIYFPFEWLLRFMLSHPLRGREKAQRPHLRFLSVRLAAG